MEDVGSATGGRASVVAFGRVAVVWRLRDSDPSVMPIQPIAIAKGIWYGVDRASGPASPPATSRRAAACGKARVRRAARPNSVQPIVYRPIVAMAPTSTDPDIGRSRAAGAAVAIIGTTNASDHQSPATIRVPRNAVMKPIRPSLPRASDSRV